jgi:hypothetical protein
MLIIFTLAIICSTDSLRLDWAFRRPSSRPSLRLLRDETQLQSDVSWVGDGSKVKIDGVSQAVFSSDGLRGVVATKNVGVRSGEDLSASLPLVTIPADLAIEVTNARPPSPFPKFVTQSFWEGCLWDQRLAFSLLYEAKILREQSEKNAWIRQLPSSYSTPYTWSDDQLLQLQYSSLTNRVKRQRKDWTAFFNTWSDSARKTIGGDFLGSDISYEDVIWALQTVNSRAFSGTYEGTSADQRQQLLLFTGALTLVWPLAGLGTWEQSLSAAIAVALSIFLRDLLTSSGVSNAALKRYVVCPFIDMFNHRSGCISDVSYNYFANQFELRTEGYKEGEQVYLSYGRQTNDRLLQYYGFVDEHNRYDNYDFNVNIIELLLAKADDMITAGSTAIPSSPTLSAEERLQTIAKALQATEVTDATYLGARRVTNTRGNKVPVRLYRQPPNSLFDGEAKEDRGEGVAGIQTTSGLLARFDDVTVRALRALFATEKEWRNFGTLRNMQPLNEPLSTATEEAVASALRSLCRLELLSKPTTLKEDQLLLGESSHEEGRKPSMGPKKGFGVKGRKEKAPPAMDPSGVFKDAYHSAVAFRIEKKTLLHEAATD